MEVRVLSWRAEEKCYMYLLDVLNIFVAVFILMNVTLADKLTSQDWRDFVTF